MATAPTAPPADGAVLPDPPSMSDPVNFPTEGDSFLLALIPFQAAMNAFKAWVYSAVTGAYNNALEALASATAAATSASLAAGYAGASAWVSGATYGVGDKRWSLSNGFTYRRIVAGAGTTDPASDATNWEIWSLAVPVRLISANVQQAISGCAYAFTNATAQAAATNQFIASDDLSDPAWVKTECTVSVNVGMDQDGNQISDKLVESSGAAVRYFQQTITTAANVARCTWGVVEASGRSTFAVTVDRDAGADLIGASFSTVTGLATTTNAGTGSGATAAMVYLGAGLWLWYLSGTPSSSAGTTVRTVVYLNVQGSYTGDGASGLRFCSMHTELGTVPTSRIKTTTVAVTRAAGLVAPQRLVLPLSPSESAWARVVPRNGITTNIIDPNGQTFTGPTGTVLTGPLTLDLGEAIDLQFINGTWKRV